MNPNAGSQPGEPFKCLSYTALGESAQAVGLRVRRLKNDLHNETFALVDKVCRVGCKFVLKKQIIKKQYSLKDSL